MRVPLIVCAAALTAAMTGSTRAAQQVVTWTPGGNGLWTDPSKWSGGVVPNNSGANTFAVFIDGGNAATSSVFLGASSLPSITLDSLNISSGDLLRFSSDNASPPFQVLGATTVDGLIRIDGFSTLITAANGAINGAGTIQSFVTSGTTPVLRSSASGLTIGSSLTVRGSGNLIVGSTSSGPLVNRGTVVADTGVLTLAGTSISNLGTLRSEGFGIVAIDSTFRMSDLGTFQNGFRFRINGTLDSSAATFRTDATTGNWELVGTLKGGTYESADGKRLTVPIGVTRATIDDVSVDGDLHNAGGTLLVPAGQSLHGAGTLTIDDFHAATYSVGAPTIIGSGMTVHGGNDSALTQWTNVGTLTSALINNGRIVADVNNALLRIGGSSITNNGTLETRNGGILQVNGNFTLADLGTVVNGGAMQIGGTLINTGNTFHVDDTTGNWRLAGTLQGGSLTTANNRSLVIPNLNSGTLQNVTLNDARIDLAGNQLIVNGASGLVGTGTVTVSNNGSVTFINGTGGASQIGAGVTIQGPRGGIGDVNAPMINNGAIIATAGTSTSNLVLLANGLTNSGTIRSDAGGTLGIAGTITTPQLATIQNNGAVALRGTLENVGQTFSPGGAHPGFWTLGTFSTFQTFQTPTIHGGVIDVPVGQPFQMMSNVALDGVTLNGVAVLRGLSTLDIRNGIGGNGRIDVMIGNGSVITSSSALTIGNGMTIRGGVAGPSGNKVIVGVSTVPLDNSGTLECDGNSTGTPLSSQNGMTLFGSLITNSGGISSIHGGTMSVLANVITKGTMFVDQFSTLSVNGDLTVADGGALAVELGEQSQATRGRFTLARQLNLSSLDDSLFLIAPSSGFDPSRTWTVVTYSGVRTGTFDHVTPGFVLDYSVSGVITARFVPEPCVLLGAASIPLILRRRRASRCASPVCSRSSASAQDR